MNEVLTSQQLASKTRANQDAFFDSIVALTNQQLASKTYYQTHKEICKARVAKWLKKNRKQWNRYMRARMRLLYEQRPEEWKAYCDKNKKKIRGYQKKWHEEPGKT